MKKSTIYIINQLKPPLLEVPDLVTSLYKKKFSSLDDLMDWLVKIENRLKQLNYSECAEIAGLRAQLAQHKFSVGVKPTEKKKRQFHKALEVIYPAQEAVTKIIFPLEEKIEQARDLMKQILNVAASLNILPKPTPQNFNSYIHNVWSILATHEQIKNGINNIKSLIGMTDGLQLLAEEIEM